MILYLVKINFLIILFLTKLNLWRIMMTSARTILLLHNEIVGYPDKIERTTTLHNEVISIIISY